MKPHKKAIRAAVADFHQSFTSPTVEHVLEDNCRADFRFSMRPAGVLFVEDDDAARAINNLIKYWPWIEKNPDTGPWHLVHVIESSRPAQLKNLQFLAQKMEAAVPGFRFHLITIKSWSEAVETWLPQLRRTIELIAHETCEQTVAAGRA